MQNKIQKWFFIQNNLNSSYVPVVIKLSIVSKRCMYTFVSINTNGSFLNKRLLAPLLVVFRYCALRNKDSGNLNKDKIIHYQLANLKQMILVSMYVKYCIDT